MTQKVREIRKREEVQSGRERPGRPGLSERSERQERSGRSGLSERQVWLERSELREKTERSEKSERQARSERQEKSERQARSERQERAERRRRQEEEEAERSKKRLLHWFIALFVIGSMIAAAWLVVVKVFTLEHVKVEGNILYDDRSITSVILNDKYSDNTLYVYLKYKLKKPENVPFIDTLSIEMEDQHTLKVTVYEKGIIGSIFIRTIGENAYFDKDGIVVETSSRKIADVPVIDGISCDEVVLYEALPINADTRREILTLTQTLKKYDLLPESISYADSDSPKLNYGDIQVIVGSQDKLNEKAERISKILPSLAGKHGILHVETWTEQTTDIVFEEK